MKRNQVTSEGPDVKSQKWRYKCRTAKSLTFDDCFEAIQIFLNFCNTDIDDFIVDDDGRPLASGRSKKFSGYTDA